ncbi:MAG TPA: GntR family transcriptional regulator [Burkholderiaceae bacterium]|nr:GntR family transcriptional regulator [Burkholderiaceae bacterium]
MQDVKRKHKAAVSSPAARAEDGRQELHRSFGGLLHHQVASVIRDGIMKERFPVGHMLPPEMELCEQFSVSRITIRRAMQTLLEDGLIQRRRGLGTFVRSSKPVTTMALKASIPNHQSAAAALAALTEVEVTSFGFVAPSEEVQAALRVGPSTHVLRVERMRSNAQIPVVQTAVYLPERIGRRFSAHDFASCSLQSLMAREKQAYGRIELHCTAMLTDPVTAKSFGILIGSPLIGLKRLSFDKTGKPIEYLTGVAPPDRYDIRVSYEGGGELSL